MNGDKIYEILSMIFAEWHGYIDDMSILIKS